jgi:hypothetical protein
MQNIKLNNINYEAIKGVKMSKKDKVLLNEIFEDIKNRPASWQAFWGGRKYKLMCRVSGGYYDELDRIEKKYKINILLPITLEQYDEWARNRKLSK